LRQRAVAGVPLSTWRSAYAICSSLNLDFRIVDSLSPGTQRIKNLNLRLVQFVGVRSLGTQKGGRPEDRPPIPYNF
jgi:hypothetical protein